MSVANIETLDAANIGPPGFGQASSAPVGPSEVPMQRHAPEGALPLAVVGCDFRVASAQWRNHLLLDAAERAHMTEALRESCGAAGLVVLETCNRVEWLATAPAPQWAGEAMRAQMVDRWRQADPALRKRGAHVPKPYIYTGRAAVAHLLRVAVGLESFVVGEREIAGQLNRALAGARTAGHASPFHNALQTAVGRTVKRVQRLTTWRHHSRGVHSLALDAVQAHWKSHRPTPAHRPVAVCIGMGEIGRKAAHLLAQHGHCHVVRVNRTVPPDKVGDWRPLADLDALVPTCDAIVIATGARGPVIDLQHLATLRPADAPVLAVVDLGAPAQVANTETAGFRYLGLDDLLSLPAVSPPEEETRHVLDLVEVGVREFVLEYRKRDLAQLLRSVHDVYDRLSYQQLPQVLNAEWGGDDQAEQRKKVEAVVRDFLRDMTREVVQHIESAAETRARQRSQHGH